MCHFRVFTYTKKSEQLDRNEQLPRINKRENNSRDRLKVSKIAYTMKQSLFYFDTSAVLKNYSTNRVKIFTRKFFLL